MMVILLRQYFIKIFLTGHDRSRIVKKNISLSFIFKGCNIVINFMLVPLILSYVSSENYGVWLTLSSIVSWINHFDIGLGRGLRNNLIKAFSQDDKISAKEFVSTSYAILTIIVLILLSLLILINPFIHWDKILNVDKNLINDINKLVFVMVTFFMMRFVFNLISQIFVADQKTVLNDFVQVFINLISILAILILKKTTSNSLLYLGISLSTIPVFVLLIFNIVFFITKYRDIAPSFKFIKLRHYKLITHVGLQFFLIQITALILFSTDNLIITQLFNPTEVTKYNIAHKYFRAIFMIFGIISTPLLPAYAQAFYKNDFSWIRNIKKKLINIWYMMIGIILLMLLCSNQLYSLWIGHEIQIPFILSLNMGVAVIIKIWTIIYSQLIYGIGKIRIQMYLSIINLILNIPLSIFFASVLHLGSAGVILATNFCVGISAYFCYRQFKRIINNTAHGIWNK